MESKTTTDPMPFERVTRTLDEFGRNCFIDEDGIAATNMCTIHGFFNKCPAGSSLTYAGTKNSIDAKLACPLDSVAQSDWREASQKGLCLCEASLLDGECDVIEEKMDCQCFGCPDGTLLGFAYSCTTPIVGPCLSFDCYGVCNGKFDPGNLTGEKETFAPTEMAQDEDEDTSSARTIGDPNNHVMGTAVMVLALLRMIM